MARFSIWLRLFTLVSLLTSIAWGAPKASASKQLPAPPLSESAKKHFNAGLAYVDDPSGSKWEEAYREFLAAYADTPSWILKNNIGLCALTLERDGEAIEAYKEYLAGGGEADLSAKGRKQIETDIATLSASLVKVEIEAEPAELTLVDERKNTKGTLLINNYEVKGGKASLGLHPGRHRITAEAPGYISDEWTIDAAPGSSHAHAFKLVTAKKTEATPAVAPPSTIKTPVTEPPKPAARKTPTAVYVGAIATGVFAVGATVTGLMALSKETNYKNAPDSAEADRLAKSGKTLALVTDIEIGAAILSAGATAYFYFTAPKEAAAQSASRSRVRLTPTASPTATGLALSGSF
jgi:hypothetical protein